MTSWTESALVVKSGPWEHSRLAQSNTHAAIRVLGGNPGHDLQGNLLAFCRVLRKMIPDITTGRIIDACRSLELIDISQKDDFRTALKANLVSSREDGQVFDILFQMFGDPQDTQVELAWPPEEKTLLTQRVDEDFPFPEALEKRVSEYLLDAPEGEEGEDEEDTQGPSYSPFEVLAEKDFADFTSQEVKEIRRIIAQIAPKISTALSRRTHASSKGREVDLRRTIRANMKHGGEILKFTRRRRKVKKLNISLLCDVSGSMDYYSKFLVQLVYALQNHLTGVKAWVFSTRLTEVTPILKGHPFEEALKLLSQTAKDWSGGTSIGGSLQELLQSHGKHRLNSRTVLIIVSDGWDRGDTKILENAMKALKHRTYKILWLNPLLGGPNYQPLCAGMKTALPYIDYFLPAHNLESLMKLGRTLSALSNGL